MQHFLTPLSQYAALGLVEQIPEEDPPEDPLEDPLLVDPLEVLGQVGLTQPEPLRLQQSARLLKHIKVLPDGQLGDPFPKLLPSQQPNISCWLPGPGGLDIQKAPFGLGQNPPVDPLELLEVDELPEDEPLDVLPEEPPEDPPEEIQKEHIHVAGSNPLQPCWLQSLAVSMHPEEPPLLEQLLDEITD